MASLSAVADMRRCEPVFVSLEGAFHGKTVGAYALSDHPETPEDLVVPGPWRLRLDRVDWTPDKVVASFDAELVNVYGIEPDAAGVPQPKRYRLSPIAACFAEPIQGEGGVREVPADVLRALRRLADRHAPHWFSTRSSAAWAGPARSLPRSGPGLGPTTTCCPSPWVVGWPRSQRCSCKPGWPSMISVGITHPPSPKTIRRLRSLWPPTDLLARVEPMIAAAGQRLGTALDDAAARWPDRVHPGTRAGTVAGARAGTGATRFEMP